MLQLASLTRVFRERPVFTPLFKKTVRAFFILCVFLVQIVLQQSLRYLDTPWVEPEEERRVKWDPGLTRTLSFGYLPPVIDWLWMTALLDSNLSKVSVGTHPQLYYDLDLITDLDAAFLDVYINGGNILSVIRNDGVGARDLLLKGVAYFKDPVPEFKMASSGNYVNRVWNLYLVLAYVYLFELNAMKEASAAFQEAAALPNAPSYLASLVGRLKQPGGEYQVGLRLLKFLMEGATDSKLREGFEKKWDNLNKGYFIYQVNLDFQKFLKKTHAHFSYNRRSELWSKFLRATHTSEQDPWGGVLSVGDQGQVISSTPHFAVFGLE